MHVAIAVAVTVLIVYPLGVLTAKWVLLEGDSIKRHVSNEVDQLRTDLSQSIQALGKKI